MENVVTYNKVCKSYDGNQFAIKDLDFHIRDGEFLSLLGPSGSGKTTTLNLLAGFEPLTSGEILLSGKTLSDIPTYKRNMGMVFQNYALFPNMDVKENVAFPLIMRGMSRQPALKKAVESLSVVGLSEFSDKKPKELSGGQQQRVAIIRALIFDPTILLMDEPFGALDKRLREKMQLEVRQIHNRIGSTFIFVTHDQEEALVMSDRIAIFNEGHLQQIGTPKEIYENPNNTFVARFIGDSNNLNGTVVSKHDGYCKVAVESSEETFVAKCDASLSVGDKTSVCIRPEQVSLFKNREACRFKNNFQARVKESIYLGNHYQYELEVPGGVNWMIYSQNDDTFESINVGDTVHLGWDQNNCSALDWAAAVSD